MSRRGGSVPTVCMRPWSRRAPGCARRWRSSKGRASPWPEDRSRPARRRTNMDAIELLDSQHKDVERLFSQIEGSRGQNRLRIFRELADLLALHATLEENHFYPVVKTNDTEELVFESLE